MNISLRFRRSNEVKGPFNSGLTWRSWTSFSIIDGSWETDDEVRVVAVDVASKLRAAMAAELACCCCCWGCCCCCWTLLDGDEDGQMSTTSAAPLPTLPRPAKWPARPLKPALPILCALAMALLTVCCSCCWSCCGCCCCVAAATADGGGAGRTPTSAMLLLELLLLLLELLELLLELLLLLLPPLLAKLPWWARPSGYVSDRWWWPWLWAECWWANDDAIGVDVNEDAWLVGWLEEANWATVWAAAGGPGPASAGPAQANW